MLNAGIRLPDFMLRDFVAMPFGNAHPKLAAKPVNELRLRCRFLTVLNLTLPSGVHLTPNIMWLWATLAHYLSSKAHNNLTASIVTNSLGHCLWSGVNRQVTSHPVGSPAVLITGPASSISVIESPAAMRTSFPSSSEPNAELCSLSIFDHFLIYFYFVQKRGKPT